MIFVDGVPKIFITSNRSNTAYTKVHDSQSLALVYLASRYCVYCLSTNPNYGGMNDPAVSWQAEFVVLVGLGCTYILTLLSNN